MIKKIFKSTVAKISASQYGSAVVEGNKLSPTKLKQYVVKKIRSGGTSAETFGKELKKAGVARAQEDKRKKLIKLVTGDNEHKMTPKEERALREKIKMRIAAARSSLEIGQGGGSTTMNVRGRRSGGAEGKKAALGAVLERGGVKTTHHALGITDQKYGVSIGQEISGQGLEHRASVGQNPNNEAAPSVVSGIGTKKNLPSSGTKSGYQAPPIGFNKRG